MTDCEVNDVESVLDLICHIRMRIVVLKSVLGLVVMQVLLKEWQMNKKAKVISCKKEFRSVKKSSYNLQSSLHPSMTFVEIHIENNDSFEVSPFPLPSVNAKCSAVVYLVQKKKEYSFNGGILITVTYGKESIEIPIDDVQKIVDVEEDKFGCSIGKNIRKAIVPLFAFSILQKINQKKDVSDDDKMKAIELSISIGVLCKYTGYVGMTEQSVIQPSNNSYAHRRLRCCSHKRCGCEGGGGGGSPAGFCFKSDKCCAAVAPPRPESMMLFCCCS